MTAPYRPMLLPSALLAHQTPVTIGANHTAGRVCGFATCPCADADNNAACFHVAQIVPKCTTGSKHCGPREQHSEAWREETHAFRETGTWRQEYTMRGGWAPIRDCPAYVRKQHNNADRSEDTVVTSAFHQELRPNVPSRSIQTFRPASGLRCTAA